MLPACGASPSGPSVVFLPAPSMSVGVPPDRKWVGRRGGEVRRMQNEIFESASGNDGWQGRMWRFLGEGLVGSEDFEGIWLGSGC